MADPLIPFINLQAQHRAIRPQLDEAIRRVLDSGQFILGPEGQALEQELARRCEVDHAIGVANGTDALVLALKACGIGPGAEVITSAFSFFASAEAVLLAGASVVFADIDPDTLNIDPASVAAAITPATKAIIPVHLYGRPCDMDSLMRIASGRRLAVIEDCAQALGAKYRGCPVGSFGDAAAFSFYPTKTLGGLGDGGLVATGREDVAKRLRLLRHHGDRGRYDHVLVGTNSRLDELQAACLRVKLSHLDRWNDARRAIAREYAGALTRAGIPGVAVAREWAGIDSVHSLYTIRLPQRDRAQAELAKQGISAQVYYPSILPKQPALASLPTVAGRHYPNAERAASEVLSLPMYPELPIDAVARVVQVLRQAAGR